MTWQIAFVFAVILVALALFVAERYRIDQVALGIPAVLLAAGILSPEEAVSGFSNTATVTVAALLAISIGLTKTGVVARIGRWARSARLGGPRRRLLVLCLVVAALSPFINNTAVVVVLLPVFMSLAERDDQPASLYLMPLSFTAMLAGTVSLIGTSTNLIVYGMARERGFDELSMFSIAPLGLVYLGIGVAYVFTVGRWLMPRRRGPTDLSDKYGVTAYLSALSVRTDSPALGTTLDELEEAWEEEYDTTILGLRHGDHTYWRPGPEHELHAGDVLYAQGASEDLVRLARGERLTAATPYASYEEREEDLTAEDARLAEVLVGPNSPITERTLEETDFEQRFEVTVMAITHHEETTRTRLEEAEIQSGDLLLIHGRADEIAALSETPGFIPLREIEPPKVDRPRAVVAAGILAGVVGVAALTPVSIMASALVGVAAMIFSGCLTVEELYEELDWMVVFLLAGMIPLGIAMDGTGAARWLAEQVVVHLGAFGPYAVVAGFYVVAALLTSVVSNNATAIVLTPVAILAAGDLGINPYALLVAVMFGASASFLTPMGYQTNTMIYGPGGYRFVDFVRVGGPLNLLLIVVATLLIPVFWPS
ncbi:MAG: SLC13 family permease [Gemmatimonadota bacterium]|nr:SLC13 family permease [Gemmatimonadota bacterium]